MKRINNKGMTLVELIICFVIVSAIVVSMFNIIMSYQTEEITESSRSDIIEYKNVITKLIQTDIIKGELKNVKRISKTNTSTGTSYKFVLTFNKSLSSSKDIKEKTLEIHASDTDYQNNYIIYDDINNLGTVQKVKYLLPSSDDNCTSSSDCNITRFTSINNNINEGTNSENVGSNIIDNVTKTNLATTYFDFELTISENNVGGDYHIKIIAPLNYSYCKADK